MKISAIAVAMFFALGSALALAQGAGGGGAGGGAGGAGGAGAGAGAGAELAELPGARGQALAAVQAEPPVLPEVPQAAEVLLRDTPVTVRAAALPKRGPRTRM